MDCSLSGSSVPGDSPGKNTGVGCHALLQGTFLTQGLNLCFSMSPVSAGGFFTTSSTSETHRFSTILLVFTWFQVGWGKHHFGYSFPYQNPLCLRYGKSNSAELEQARNACVFFFKALESQIISQIVKFKNLWFPASSISFRTNPKHKILKP